MQRVAAALASFLVVGVGARAAADEEPEGVGVYGRFDHDVAISAGVGGGARIGDAIRALGATEIRASFLHTAGVAVGGSWAPGAPSAFATSLAVDLRPLFLISLFENRFTGDSVTDLVRDAIGLEAGVAWDGRHPAFLAGLGTEVPLVRDRDRGLWLRFGARVLFAREDWVGRSPGGTSLEVSMLLQAHDAVSVGIL